MTTYYAVMSALALVNLIIFLLFFREKKLNYYILAILAIMTISNAGNLVMAIADVYDALVSKRCYKEAMSFE